MKIALIGSAPSSVRIAPYQDPTWKIYGCSPGVFGVAPRVDEWFELHLYEPGVPWFSPEYCQWLKALPERGVTLWTGSEVSQLPGSRVIPHDYLLTKYDPHRWFCTSTLFWMMACAIEAIEHEAKEQSRQVSADHDKIAFYGVDMAANEEYEMQRAGIHFMAYIAHSKGIEVGAPMESDLFTPRFRYGVDEWTHSFRKQRARRGELEARIAQAERDMKAAETGIHFLRGALDDLKYQEQTWVDKTAYTGPLVAPELMHKPIQQHRPPALSVLPLPQVSPEPATYEKECGA